MSKTQDTLYTNENSPFDFPLAEFIYPWSTEIHSQRLGGNMEPTNITQFS